MKEKIFFKRAVSLFAAASMIFSMSVCFAAADDERTVDMDVSYPSCTHIAYQTESASPYGTGNFLYSTLKVTGSAMSEEDIFNVSELERVYAAGQLGLKKQIRTADGKQMDGLDLPEFIEMCGLDENASGDIVFSFYQRNCIYADASVSLENLRENDAVIAFASGGVPLVTDTASQGYVGEADNQGGPLMLVTGDGKKVSDLSGIRVSEPEDTEDPHYGFHTRDPLKYMESTVFTVNYVDQSQYPETDDAAVPFRTYTFTMKEIEDLMTEHPEKASGNYYGISGNEATKNTLGLGGFTDYYEGISLGWLLRERTGLVDGEGKAVLYGRDNDRFGEIGNLGYFFANRNYSNYYSEIDVRSRITGVEPVLAVSKNGYPLLPRHDHEMEGYVDYNTFNANALALGFESKIGIVKNISGPFVAGLADLDGVYGGYRNETNGDCVRMDLYVDRSAYENENPDRTFSDVPPDSWFAPSVGSLAKQNIVSGISEDLFAPYENVTRAEFVKMIAACSGEDVSGCTEDYSDVDGTSWAAPYIGWAEQNGIVSGTGNGMFGPDDPVTREQMAAITDRYLKAAGKSMVKLRQPLLFTDQEEISSYAAHAVQNLTQYGILNGKGDGSFDPKGSSTRAEAAAAISMLVERCI